MHRLSIVSPKDSGEEYQIYDDKICYQEEIRSYVRPLSLNDYNLEKMTRSIFCEKWIARQ